MDAEMNKDEMYDKRVEEEFNKLLDAYLASPHRRKVEIITKAFNFAKHAHKGVKRLSGEPYIMHPIAVAQIVCSDIGLGSTSICAALLHDVVEDTDYTVEDIENMFGHKIAQIVDGLTKISGGIFGDHASAQAENFKKLLLTMSDDIRVILIKMADRLHNMRTLGSQPLNKRYKIAGETLYIYAPLANRLGLNTIKSELEDLSFKYEHPAEYEDISNKLKDTEEHRNMIFEHFTAPIRTILDAKGIKYEIKARVKTPYSIWSKMQNKHLPFEEIYDILAVRIIFEPTAKGSDNTDCFSIYVALTQIYKSHPDRIRDWVSHPKANGYQALHVTLMSNDGEWIEVQIRSQKMNEVAERGFAAHWKYKEKNENSKDGSEAELDKWLTTIKEILDDPQPDAIDFLDTIKLNLFASEIFVFTPKGEFRTMPSGSTVLDFAFTIHTFVGSHCIGAKVNHKLVPMSYRLSSGDQVEVIISNSQHVTVKWLEMVTTAKARSKISSILRKEEREARNKGEEIINEFFAKEDIQQSSENMEKLAKFHEFNKMDSFLISVGQEKIKLGNADKDYLVNGPNGGRNWMNIFRFGRKTKDEKKEETTSTDVIDRKKELELNEDTIRSKYVLAECCKPIPGDQVMGYIDDDNRIVIHKVDCSLGALLKSSHGNRILSAKWNMKRELLFPASIFIKGLDKIGLLNQITQVISQLRNVNIRKLQIESDNGLFECKMEMFVHDTTDLNNIISDLKKIQNVKEVSRI
ncbi:MAG: bifunctional (p)ppGpp synthetase/guanosine-3',5'-bis(diphosphate) 3'-pyrophosphohydrolase [Bacteroidaceae bacterium]|nr:bifunctional (p)ppGpp synthetase/guanosine-3',5'-bis(diphosphate) 3'-pyrophosphohydrolase [Bacteroidaceae bacterium]